jgi:hypothetical protein
MSDLAIEIAGFVVGDDLEIRRAVTDLPAAIVAAWLTAKLHPGQSDEDARLQKRITITDVPGTGQIVTAGGPGTDGDLRFDLLPEDTERLGPKRYVHDIQIRLETGKVYTIEKGTLQLTAGVTTTTT